MFDDDDRVALFHQFVQHRQQHLDIFEMQPRRRFVQNIQRLAGAARGQFLGQFDALGFAAGQIQRTLPQFDVIQTDTL